MRLIRVKPSSETRRRFKERTQTEVTTATLWPVNDEEAVHDAATRSGRLDSEPWPPKESWMKRFLRGLKDTWTS